MEKKSGEQPHERDLKEQFNKENGTILIIAITGVQTLDLKCTDLTKGDHEIKNGCQVIYRSNNHLNVKYFEYNDPLTYIIIIVDERTLQHQLLLTAMWSEEQGIKYLFTIQQCI